jgi:hypothetical protein
VWVQNGGVVMGIMTSGIVPGTIPTKADLDAWITSSNGSYTFVLDAAPPEPTFQSFFVSQMEVPKSSFLIFDAQKMQPIALYVGLPQYQAGLTKFSQLLGVSPPDGGYQ